MFRIAHVGLFAILLAASNGTRAQEFRTGSPNPNTPELKELSRFEGKWESSLPDSDQKVLSTRRWVLNGSFLKHDFQLSGGSVQGTIYRGYDKSHSRYTLTMLDSTGNVSLLTGHWDEDLKTMIFEAINSSGNIQKYESYFPDETTEQWTITLNNGSQLSATSKKTE